MTFLPFSVSSNNSNFPVDFDDPYRSGAVSQNPIGIGLSEDDGFEIFDPRGLFSPRRRLSADDARFNNEQEQQSPPPELSPSKPTSVLTSFQSPTSITASSSDQFDPPLLLQFNQTAPKSSLSPRPWSLLTNPVSDELTSSPTTDGFIDVTALDLRSESIQPKTYDGGGSGDVNLNSPIDSCPVSPCSSLPLNRSRSGSMSQESPYSVYSPPMIPRGRSTLRRFVFEARSSLRSSSSPDHHHSSSKAGIAGVQAIPQPVASNQAHCHHHRPTPILTCRPPCGTRDTSLPTRLYHAKSPDDLSASVSSLAYSEMASSPAVDFLASFAESTVPVNRQPQHVLDQNLLGLLDEGDEVAGHVLGPIIGRGGFSIVREATVIETCEKVAVKIVRHSSQYVISDSAADRSKRNLTSSVNPASGQTPELQHSSPSFRDRSSSTPVPYDSHLAKSTHLPLPTSVTESLAAALLKREIEIWSSLKQHPHLVSLLSIHTAPHQTLIFMPLCKGGNLLQMLNDVKRQDGQVQNSSGVRPDSGLPPPQLIADLSRGLQLVPQSPQPSGLHLGLVRHIFQQIVHGLKYLHLEAGVTHKDIKLENILIHDGKVKISDFGLAVHPSPSYNRVSADTLTRDLSLPKHFKRLPRIKEGHPSGASLALSHSVRERRGRHPRGARSPVRYASLSKMAFRDDSDESSSSDEVLPTAAGSLAYTPPEQLRSGAPLTDPSLDIWALGCVLYALLEGNLPFQDDFEPRLRLKIMNGQYRLPCLLSSSSSTGMSPEDIKERKDVADLLKGCLAVDKNARWTIEQIANCGWINSDAQVPLSSSHDATSPSAKDTDSLRLHNSLDHETFTRSFGIPLEPRNGDDTPKPGVTQPSLRSPLGLHHPTRVHPQHSLLTSPWDPLFDLRDLLAHVSSNSTSANEPRLPLGDLPSPTSVHERSSRSRTRDSKDQQRRTSATNSVSPSSRSQSRGVRARFMH